MILKKPYAFLIKNFRAIHILLTLLCVFITYKTTGLIVFFREYILNNYSVTVTDNLVTSTISPLLFIAIILNIIMISAILFLLKRKNKPNKIYLFSLLYYFILLIFLIIATFLIGSLSNGLWSTVAARSYRDLAQIIYLPNYFFTIVIFIRALGFNVKQFNFKDDLKELEITDADSEEIELNLNFKTYKAERTIRRFIREFRYYFLENKRIFILLGIILTIVLGYTFFKNSEKINYNYKENKTFTYDGFNINIEDSMITNLNLSGNEIEKDKYYLVIRFNIQNNTKEDKYLDYSNIKLNYDNKYINPTLDVGKYFVDYGNAFMNNNIPSRAKRDYVMSYEIDKKKINKSFKIEIYNGAAVKKKEFLAKNIIVKLKPTIYENVEVVRNAKVNESITFSSTNLKESNLIIKGYDITKRYEYEYKSCYKDTCNTFTDVIVSDNTYQNTEALLVLDYELNLDKSSLAYTNINGIKAFSENFMKVEYYVNNEKYVSKVKFMNPANYDKKIILQTDGHLLKADKIHLLITIRNRCYVVTLK